MLLISIVEPETRLCWFPGQRLRGTVQCDGGMGDGVLSEPSKLASSTTNSKDATSLGDPNNPK